MNAGHPLRAAVWMLGAIVSFTAMAIAGRALVSTHDTFEIMTYRSLIGFVIVITIAWRAGTLRHDVGNLDLVAARQAHPEAAWLAVAVVRRYHVPAPSSAR